MKQLTLFFTIGLLISCSSPMDKAYNSQTFPDDMVLIKDKVSEEDFKTLASYLAAINIGQVSDSSKTSTIGKTYDDLLTESKVWQAEKIKVETEQKNLAEKAQKEEAERTKRLNDALIVVLYKKGFEEGLYQQFITLFFAYENKSDKEIRAFTGSVEITDLFGAAIIENTLTVDHKIEAHSTFKEQRTIEYNQFIDSHSSLLSKKLEDLKIVWKPSKIIFSDGTTLE